MVVSGAECQGRQQYPSAADPVAAPVPRARGCMVVARTAKCTNSPQ